MKLCAIYNVWNDWDLLKYSIKNIRPLVEGVIIVGSVRSNFGELSPIPQEWLYVSMENDGIQTYIREPQFKQPSYSETDKRNFGLEKAKELGFTHFLTIDSDEFYEHDPFLKAKERFHVENNLSGLVCDCQTYFKSPKLTIGLDTTLVPFIHVLTPTIRHEFNRNYPFAWEHGWKNKGIRIDPTRSLNINSGVEKIDLRMHHMSWVRKDYKLKIRNSTARTNLERSCIMNDLVHAKEGYFVEYYGKTLERSEVDFNIPEYEPDNSD
jgi:hypothetical protein